MSMSKWEIAAWWPVVKYQPEKEKKKQHWAQNELYESKYHKTIPDFCIIT